MAGAGGRILGAGLADDILMDLGPLTLVVARVNLKNKILFFL